MAIPVYAWHELQHAGMQPARFAEQTLDRGEDLLGLIAHALAFRLIGDLAGKIDGRAMDDGLRHARTRVQSGDSHG